MKQPTLTLFFVAFTSLGLSGCSLFSAAPPAPAMIPVNDATVFVEEALKAALAESAEKKQRPSQISFSFYADDDVNAMTKQRRAPHQTTHSPQRVKPFQPPQPVTTWIKYSLECERTGTWRLTDCRTVDTLSLLNPENLPKIRFKRITRRHNSRLNILTEQTPLSTAASTAIEYNLQCDRNEPGVYSHCRPADQALAADTKASAPRFAIKQLELTDKNNHLEIVVEQHTIKPRERVAYRAPKPPEPLELPEVESYVDAKPIGFKVVMLKDNSLLISADQESLNADLEDTLGKNYIDHDDYVLTPGQFKFVNFARVDSDTHYIGVIADYRDGSRAVWKKTLKIEPTGNVYPIHIHFKRKEVDILTED